MIEKIRPLNDYRETVAEIQRIAWKHRRDMLQFIAYGDALRAVYNVVHALPYIADPQGVETVSRPAYTLQAGYSPRDCDDKTVLLGSFCNLIGLPWRIVVSGREDFPHHVYPEAAAVDAPGEWIALDATYPDRGGLGLKLWPEKFRETYPGRPGG